MHDGTAAQSPRGTSVASRSSCPPQAVPSVAGFHSPHAYVIAVVGQSVKVSSNGVKAPLQATLHSPCAGGVREVVGWVAPTTLHSLSPPSKSESVVVLGSSVSMTHNG